MCPERLALLQATLEPLRRHRSPNLRLGTIARQAQVPLERARELYPDEAALLAGLSAQGFERLERAMRREAERFSDPLLAFQAAGVAYVSFALDHPQHFEVMFHDQHFEEFEEYAQEAADRSFGAVLELIALCQAHGRMRSGDRNEMAALAWSMVHGIASLGMAGRLRGHSHPFRDRDAFLDFACRCTRQVVESLATPD
ncbi:MAG: TetR-like C-terminal domain-containing protein [Planctomycetota bacterium]